MDPCITLSKCVHLATAGAIQVTGRTSSQFKTAGSCRNQQGRGLRRAYPLVQGACSLASHRLPVGPAAVLPLAASEAALPIVRRCSQVEGLVQETRAVGRCAGRRPQLQGRRLLNELPVAQPPAGTLLAKAWRAFPGARAVACTACRVLEPTLCSSPPSVTISL